MDRDTLKEGIAEILRDLRQKKGLSKSRMALIAEIDDHTWSAWETGKSCPSVIDFIDIFRKCGENAVAPVLKMLHPSHTRENDITSLRESAAHYFEDFATDHQVRLWHYLMFGDHGSNHIAQFEEFCALDHLPMENRYAIAEMIYMFFVMSDKRNELVCTDSVMPNMDTWVAGLKAGQKAAFAKLQSYKDGG